MESLLIVLITAFYSFFINFGYEVEDLNVKSLESSVVIREAGIDIPIFTGTTENNLKKGASRLDGNGIPIKSGNIVIAGHRLRAGAPLSKTFYNLPKVHKGTKVVLIWNGVDYHYVVDTVTIVKATTKIEVHTAERKLTLVTCTPLVSSSHRLIVTAKEDANYKRKEN